MSSPVPKRYNQPWGPGAFHSLPNAEGLAAGPQELNNFQKLNWCLIYLDKNVNFFFLHTESIALSQPFQPTQMESNK